MPAQAGNVQIPNEARQAADRGDVIEAIKITREATGLGLKEARDAVDAYSSGAPARPAGANDNGLSLEAIASLHRGNFLDAIKYARAQSGLGLKDAKEAVEHYLDANPDVRHQFRAATANELRRVLWRIAGIAVTVAIVVLGYMWFAEVFRDNG